MSVSVLTDLVFQLMLISLRLPNSSRNAFLSPSPSQNHSFFFFVCYLSRVRKELKDPDQLYSTLKTILQHVKVKRRGLCAHACRRLSGNSAEV